MNRVAILAILASALLSPGGWAQTAGPATAATGDSGQVSAEQAALAHTVDSAPQSAQPGTAPKPIPDADQNGTNQTPTKQPPTNAKEDSDLARIPTDTQPAAATPAKHHPPKRPTSVSIWKMHLPRPAGAADRLCLRRSRPL
jgi:hypothetical protein